MQRRKTALPQPFMAGPCQYIPIYNPQTPRDLGADRTVGPVRPQSDRPTLVRPF